MCAVNVYLCSNLKAKKEKQIDAYFFHNVYFKVHSVNARTRLFNI